MTLFYSHVEESDPEQPFFILSYCQLLVINFKSPQKICLLLIYKILIININILI